MSTGGRVGAGHGREKAGESGRLELPAAVAAKLSAIVGEAGMIVDPGALLVYESDGLTAYRERPCAVVADRKSVV